MMSIIGSVMGIAATLVGNHYLAKWLGAIRMWMDSMKDPELKKMVFDEYQRLNAEAQDLINQPPPI